MISLRFTKIAASLLFSASSALYKYARSPSINSPTLPERASFFAYKPHKETSLRNLFVQEKKNNCSKLKSSLFRIERDLFVIKPTTTTIVVVIFFTPFPAQGWGLDTRQKNENKTGATTKMKFGNVIRKNNNF